MNLRIGDMAQLVDRRVRNAKARGSNPLISTSEPRYTRGSFFYTTDGAEVVCGEYRK